jgi:GH24 family phage-related lysozyme (muramidase)
MDVNQKYTEHLEGLEGRIPYMYLDSEGKVTVGLGHQIVSPEAATGLRFYWARLGIDYDQPASAEDIRWAFEVVRKRQELASVGHTEFEPLTHIRMTPNDIGDVAVLDIIQKVAEIKERQGFSGFDTFPPTARLGLLDIAYNPGVGKSLMKRRMAGSRYSEKQRKCGTGSWRPRNPGGRKCPRSAMRRCGNGSRRRLRRSLISSTPPTGRRASSNGTSS